MFSVRDSVFWLLSEQILNLVCSHGQRVVAVADLGCVQQFGPAGFGNNRGRICGKILATCLDF